MCIRDRMISILERDDMVEAMLWYLGALFLLLLICTSVGIQVILKGVFRPLHKLSLIHIYGRRFYHLYNLNTRIVLIVTFLLLAVGTVGIAFFEWNASFAGIDVYKRQTMMNLITRKSPTFSTVRQIRLR